MIRSAFFEDPVFTSMGEVQQREERRTLKKVAEFEESTGQALEDGFTREKYVALFNSMKIRRTYNLYHFKSLLSKYVDYLISNGSLDPEQRGILDSIVIDDLNVTDYFKNLNTLYNAVKDTIEYAMEEKSCIDEAAFYPAAAAIFLLWYGLTKQEIVDYLKKDILDDGIMIHGEKIVPPYGVLNMLTLARDSDGYFQRAKADIYHKYPYSEYLIRSRYSHHIKVSGITNLIAHANDVKGGEYSLEPNVIRQSGIFFRAYQMECESVDFNLSDPVFASKVFCEDFTGESKKYKVAHTSRIQDFKLYKQLFY